MASITLENLNKTYPNGVHAVRDVDLAIADGEFMVLVGPSGCGKTTLLRMIAGLEDISAGTMRIGDRLVNDLTPKDRDIAMVFQNYALYPHMTVAQNIGFSLKITGMSKQQINDRVTGVARALGLLQWLQSKPSQLSGGQRQRVAMGRAIVREPAAFLMDEPLSNLDAKLRVHMRAEVSRIQRRLSVATVYVTHDQVEAMTMGDRVAVMRDGRVQQCAEPQTLYDHPRNMFVAAFIGSPAMNLFEVTLEPEAAALTLGSQRIVVPETVRAARPALARFGGREVVIGLRPEHLSAATSDEGDESAVISGEVELAEALGSDQYVRFTIDAERVLAEGADEEDEEQLIRRGETIARVDARIRMRPGDRARFAIDIERAHFFDPADGASISREAAASRQTPV